LVDLGCQAGIWRYAFKTELAQTQLFGKFRMGEDQVYLARLNLNWESIEFTNKVSYRYIKGLKTQLTRNTSRISWLEQTIKEYLSEGFSSFSKNDLSLAIGIRLIFTLIKNGRFRQRFRGLRMFRELLAQNKLGAIKMFSLTARVSIKAISND
jgi:hypothetical protein